MICINVIYCIPLLKIYIDVDLDAIESRVYENVFKKNIDKRTFKRVLDKAKLSFVPEGGNLVQQGQMYDGVYLVAKLKKTHQLIFRENEAEIFREGKPYTWMGIIEYDQMRKSQIQKKEYKWPISISLEKKTNSDEIEVNDPLSKKYEEPLYIYFFKFEEIQKLYDEENGIHVRNALHSVWLEATTHKIIEIDLKVSKIQNKGNDLSLIPNQKIKPEEKGFFEKVKDVVCGDEDVDKNESQQQLNGNHNDQDAFVDKYETHDKLMQTEMNKDDILRYSAYVKNEVKDEKLDNEIQKQEINQINHKVDDQTRLQVEDVNLEEKHDNSINQVANDNKDSLEHVNEKKDSLDQIKPNNENKEEEYSYEDNLSAMSGFNIANDNIVDNHS